VACAAALVLSADKAWFPVKDIAPARRCNPDNFATALLRKYPDDVLGVVDALSVFRSPLTREEVLTRVTAAGTPWFATVARGRG
jgi:hypothetical protein